MIRRSLSASIFAFACLATLLLMAAVIVRCTVLDRLHGYLLLYYLTPWPAIAVGAGVCATYWFRRGCRFIAALLVLLSLTTAFAWLAHDWQWRPDTRARGELRIVHWNVDRPDRRQPGTMRWLAAQDADIIAIAEREPKKKDTIERWQTGFPGYRLVPARGETLCLVRGEVLSVVENEIHSYKSYGTSIRVRVRGREITVLQVDINGTPWVSRSEALGQLLAVVQRHRGENLILVGDFNTPLDSVFIAPFRQEMTNAFEAAGSGCAATWPMPFPVLSLDQIWTSPSLRPVRCEHLGSWRSDHRAVRTEIDFAPPMNAQP